MRSVARREPCRARSNLASRTKAHPRECRTQRAARRSASASSHTTSRAPPASPCAILPNSPSGHLLRYSGSMQPRRPRGELPSQEMPLVKPSPSHCEPFDCPSPCHIYDAHNMQSIKCPPRAHNRTHTTETPPGVRTTTCTLRHSSGHMHAPTAPTTHPRPSPMHDPCSPRTPHSRTSPAPRCVPLALPIARLLSPPALRSPCALRPSGDTSPQPA